MTDIAVMQLQERITALEERLALYEVNGLADSFSGAGQQMFGGGKLRLDKTGIQILSSGNHDQNGAFYYLPTYQPSIPFVATHPAPNVGQWNGISGNAVVDDNQIRMAAKNVTDGRDVGFFAACYGTTAYVAMDARYLATDNYGEARMTATATQVLFTLAAGLSLFSPLSPTQLTASVNDYAPTGILSSNVLRLTASAAWDITGITAGAAGQMFLITNIGSFTITLKNQSASSAVANRFALKADIAIAADGGVVIIYDATSQRWRCVGSY